VTNNLYLSEGGNIFKDAEGNPRTQRINLADIESTVKWLESVTGLPLQDNMLGSTGKKPTSGDLDLGVDSNQISKDELAQKLSGYVSQHGQDPRDWVRKSGISVHFLTPIAGRAGRGFVQTDFMFVPKMEWARFMLSGSPPDSAYKGASRNILINSMGKALGYKLNQNAGLMDRATNELITDDPDEIARMLLNSGATRDDLGSVESILAALKNDPDRDRKLADFRDHMAQAGTPIDETVDVGETSWLARLRDRIVNQGYQPLIEHEIVTEVAEPGVGGRAKGIEHLEDLVFRRGTAGVRQAIDILQHAAENPGTTTVKWDGKPAVIFGRKPDTGEFVLTDGAGFEARGYDGLATSPEQMADIQRQRSGERTELINLYARLFPILQQAIPDNFRGYVKGDLLYTSRPPLQAGNYVFQPNTVEYRIPARSGLGQRIGASEIGIAMHSMYADQGDPAQPLSRVSFQDVPGLLLIEPIRSRGMELDAKLMREIQSVVRSRGAAIDTLFSPAELRAQQITDLAKLCVDYINFRIGTGNFDNLLSGFGEWLKTKVSSRKYANIIEYLRSPQSNTEGMAAAFTLFILLHDLKMRVLQQLDQQSPGNEGWVMATPQGYAKAVNRFDFTARNRARNNP
jgi:hypothetical protein